MTMARRSPKALYVVCISNRGYQAALVSRRIYQSLPDPEAAKRSLIRVVDETGEDYLYPSKMFVAIDIPQAVEKTFKKAS
jgi:hypothetical protein